MGILEETPACNTVEYLIRSPALLTGYAEVNNNDWLFFISRRTADNVCVEG